MNWGESSSYRNEMEASRVGCRLKADVRDDTQVSTPSPIFPTTPSGRSLAHYVGISVQQVPYPVGLRWNRVSNLEPFGLKAEYLPLGHLSSLSPSRVICSDSYQFSFYRMPPPSGRGGLVVKSPFWGRRVPGSIPDSTEDPPCMGPVAC
ncbi:hypothetical protein AVEN_128147-1 [Araneus ventricosus]|uniref:Uncharacterized protein n=1 Tax=Araneus ventricosus TaxID=182803 RepID=A0A4Y2A0Y8_ARAVE|nr:hypothetical protein AVEN_128147-1 [Araneus ventricosus]